MLEQLLVYVCAIYDKGYEISQEKVSQLNRGELHFIEPDLDNKL